MKGASLKMVKIWGWKANWSERTQHICWKCFWPEPSFLGMNAIYCTLYIHASS